MELTTPISEQDINTLQVGNIISITGYIYTGRDAVLPKIVQACDTGNIHNININLQGSVIFHTAVSIAGIGPTSSNKLEIEDSIRKLSRYGVKIHLGKGSISPETIQELKEQNSIYAIIPPVTALLASKTTEKTLVAYPELGMEAMYRIYVNKYEIIVAAAHGESIYDR